MGLGVYFLRHSVPVRQLHESGFDEEGSQFFPGAYIRLRRLNDLFTPSFPMGSFRFVGVLALASIHVRDSCSAIRLVAHLLDSYHLHQTTFILVLSDTTIVDNPYLQSYPAIGRIRDVTRSFFMVHFRLSRRRADFFSDTTGVRTLSASTYADATDMTVENCISFCDDRDFIYAGVEWSQECCKLLPTAPSLIGAEFYANRL